MSEADNSSHLYGVLVTYRRPRELAAMLAAVIEQTRSLERLVVVDNAPMADTRNIVRVTAPDAEYIPASENFGPAGGIALGMQRLLEIASDRDWIVSLDDDDPPNDPFVFARLHKFAREAAANDAATAAVGLAGVRFDRRKGRTVRVPDDQLCGAVSVDYIGGNQCPTYSVGAIRAVGPPRSELFFGLDDLELGLRLRDAGYALYAHGSIWYENRVAWGRLGLRPTPSRRLRNVTWRRYYSLRNLVYILRGLGRTPAAIRVTLVVGLVKPVYNLLRDPRRATRQLLLNARACRDAWTNNMGRTVEPPT